MNYVHFNNPLFPWYWRIAQGLANLTDGIITIVTLGFVNPGFGSRCAIDCLKWGIGRMDENGNLLRDYPFIGAGYRRTDQLERNITQ